MRTAEQEKEIQARLSAFQSVYDSVLEPMRRSAAPPSQGISVNEFRRRSLGYIQQFLPPSSKWRGISLDGCMSDALNVIEPQVLSEARLTAANPRLLAQTPAARADTLDPNIKAIECNDGGTRSIRYFGQSFVVGMGRPGRLVTSFTTDRGKYKFTHGGGRWF
jgi:hypothetical protein